jgi:hypothetical protein
LYYKIIDLVSSYKFNELEELVKSLKIEAVNHRKDVLTDGTVSILTQYLLCNGDKQVILAERYMKEHCPKAFKHILRQYKLRMIENAK